MEAYLFEDVRAKFHAQQYIDAFDLFSIVIWKANRAKSQVGKRLLKNPRASGKDLEDVACLLTGSLYDAQNHKERLRILMKDWGFELPMATSVLSVFWPDDFTVYDYRVRDGLIKHCGRDFPAITNLKDFDVTWGKYEEYKKAVNGMPPAGLSLRDKDRYIWGCSVALQLREQIKKCFGK